MKKILLALITFFFVFVIVGCVDIVTTATTTTQATTQPTTTVSGQTTQPTTTVSGQTTQPTTTVSGQTTQPTTTQTTISGQTTVSEQTTVPTTAATTTTTPKVIMDLPDAEVTINFWHIYGAGKTELLDQLIAEFEAMYPNVTIESTSQSDYNTLREKINLGISVGQVPTMALGYPDHFAAYITTDAVLALDNYINSNVAYEVLDSSSSIFGELVDVGMDLSDFPESYLAENNQYVGGYYYSLPFSKSTETMAVNRTVLKAHVSEIRALGITISDEGFLSHDTPLTFAQVQLLSTILVNETAVTDVPNYQCGYLLNYDSSGNMFINMSRQWKAPYTNSTGAILINNDTTKNMLNYIKAMFDARTFVLPNQWSQTFGSFNFTYGDVCMSVGSTAGVGYNIPLGTTDLEKFGKFEVDYLPVPQTVSESDTAVTMSTGTNNYNITGALSAVQQGPNIGIFKSGTQNQKLFAWLFVKWLMTTENTARWAMSTGYLPARLSAFTSDVPIALTSTYSTTYSDFMQIAQDYWDLEGLITSRDTNVSDSFLVSKQWNSLAVNSTTGIGAFTMVGEKPTDLLITKYIEGTATNKALEIYNGTGAGIDLSAYSLLLYADGSTSPTATLTLSGTLADGDVYVVYNSTDAGIVAAGDLFNATVINFDGNDVVVLKKGTVVIDSIGKIGNLLNFAQDVTLVRKSVTTWEKTDDRWTYLYSSMVANIARSQTSFYQYDPAFAAGGVSSGSAQVRVEAGYCLENIFTGAYTPTGALSFMVNQLIWG